MSIGFSFEELVKKVLNIENTQLTKDKNLSDLEDADEAIQNLNLGSSSKKDIGTDLENLADIQTTGTGGYTLINQAENTEFPDPNDINRNGFFFYPNGHTNLPHSEFGFFLISFVNKGDPEDPAEGSKAQLCIQQGESASGGIYTRGQNNSESNWSDWTNQITA